MDFDSRLRETGARGAEGVVEMVNAILREGLRRGASDIHVEPDGDRVLVRFRLDGVLHPAVAAPTAFAGNVIARLKVLADLLTYQTDTPQEGRIARQKIGAPADLRVSTFPTVHGEKAVIRLFDPGTQNAGLADLGYPEALRAEVERQLQMPRGVILLTGPAGSGKTTTIYAALKYVLDRTGGTRHIVTVEDPVERVVAGVTQTQVHPATGLTFARCLRSLMRQDPEVIVIGEVRDEETAGIAIEAGLTGHLVISTIHSGTAAGVVTRLLEMGVAPHLITSSVNFIVAQRLLRRLCPECRKPVARTEELLGLPSNLLGHAHDAVGCDACFHTGYLGRAVIAESLHMAPALRERVLARASTEVIEAAAIAELRLLPLRAAALDAVRAGVTSPAELRRVMGPE